MISDVSRLLGSGRIDFCSSSTRGNDISNCTQFKQVVQLHWYPINQVAEVALSFSFWRAIDSRWHSRA